MFFLRRRKTEQHVIDGAKQALMNYRIHLVGLSLEPLGSDDVADDNGNLIEWTQEEMDKNAAELVRVDAELAKF